jgi:hypothetical protein
MDTTLQPSSPNIKDGASDGRDDLNHFLEQRKIGDEKRALTFLQMSVTQVGPCGSWDLLITWVNLA